MKYIIDRFEGSFAVAELENGDFANVPKAALPPQCREGDVVEVKIDVKETECRKEEAKKLQDSLFDD